MGGAAHAQVDLAEVDVPPAFGPRYEHEVDAEGADHAVGRQHLAHAPGPLLDVEAVLGAGREPAPQVHLVVVPAQDLIVVRDHLDGPTGCDPQLDAGRDDTSHPHQLLDHGATALDLGRVRRP